MLQREKLSHRLKYTLYVTTILIFSTYVSTFTLKWTNPVNDTNRLVRRTNTT